MPKDALAVEYSESGKTIFSFSREGFGPRELHNVHSLAKSILAALFGIAMEKGMVNGLESDVSRILWGEQLGRPLTWQQLLTMKSGFPSTSGENYGAWVSSKNWVNYFRKLERNGGFTYSTGDSHLLAVALRKRVGGNLSRFAREELFVPLKTGPVRWDYDPQGNEFGGNNMRMSFSAVKKFGAMLMNSGVFQGKRIVPESWIKAMWEKQTDAPDSFVAFDVEGYGYLWWLVKVNGSSGKCALGYGGQFLCIFPERKGIFTIFSEAPGNKRAINDHYVEIQKLLKNLLKHPDQSGRKTRQRAKRSEA